MGFRCANHPRGDGWLPKLRGSVTVETTQTGRRQWRRLLPGRARVRHFRYPTSRGRVGVLGRTGSFLTSRPARTCACSFPRGFIAPTSRRWGPGGRAKRREASPIVLKKKTGLSPSKQAIGRCSNMFGLFKVSKQTRSTPCCAADPRCFRLTGHPCMFAPSPSACCEAEPGAVAHTATTQPASAVATETGEVQHLKSQLCRSRSGIIWDKLIWENTTFRACGFSLFDFNMKGREAVNTFSSKLFLLQDLLEERHDRAEQRNDQNRFPMIFCSR